MIVRSELQQGKQVHFQPGWDCHGLPIEIKALEALKEREGEAAQGRLDAVGIRKVARELAVKTVEEQKEGFKEWGVMADWDHPYLTLNKEFELKQLGVFLEMTKQGLIFRRYKPVYWSPSSKSALAEAELEYNDKHESRAAFVKFQVVGTPKALQQRKVNSENLHAVIWTTTPWTLPANKAIGFHRDMEYCIIQTGEEQLIVAKARLDHIKAKCSPEANLNIIIDSIPGSELEGMTYRNTLRGTNSSVQPLLFADFVTADAGTGLVHLAPGFGMEDYELCTRHGIPAFAPVDDSGCFTDEALPESPETLLGKPVLGEGNTAVLELLGDKVLMSHPQTHKYPYDWRTKLPIIVRATAQWFADVGHIKDTALKAMDDVKFIPANSRPRLEAFVNNRSEWCISRQRAWGVPIPALYHENGEAVLTEESVSHIIATVKERGIDAWWTDAADSPAWIPGSLKGQSLRRGKDTMDVWFDSGTSWTQSPGIADVYCEGTDQHRGWFQSSLLTHVSASGTSAAPFKKLVTHGFTLDKNGRKMSKSVGNVISPSEIMDGTILPLDPPKRRGKGQPKHPAGVPYYEALGPDALRLWVAGSDYTTDVILSETVFATTRRQLIRYRNTIKMMFSNLHPGSAALPITKRDTIALYQLQQAQLAVAAAYKEYDFHKAVEIINKWISVDVSGFYAESVKDRMYCGDGGSVMYPLFMGFMHMLSPVLPGLVEESWENRPQWMKDDKKIPHPLHVANGDLGLLKVKFPVDLPKQIEVLNAANTAQKAAQEEGRAAKVIGSSLASRVVLDLPEQALSLLKPYENELEDIFVVSQVEFGSAEGVESEWVYRAAFETEGGKATAWVLPPKEHKCGRCWKYQAEVEEALCERCDDVVAELEAANLKEPEA